MCVEKAWSPICTRVAGGRLRADLNSNAHRDKHKRASCLETTCKRKEIKFDLDIQCQVSEEHAGKCIQQTIAYINKELRIGLEWKQEFVSCQNIIAAEDQGVMLL